MKRNLLNCLFIYTVSLLFSVLHAQNSLESSEYGKLIINYLNNTKRKYALLNEDIKNLIITNSYTSDNTGLTHLYLNQTYRGIKIHNAISSIAIKRDTVFYYSNRFLNSVSNKINTTNPSVTPNAAIKSLANHFQLGDPQNLEELEQRGNLYVFSNGEISNQNITAELVYYNSEELLKLAWDITIYVPGNTHWYSTRVDALTNDILETHNLILNCVFEKNHAHSYTQNSILDLFNTQSTVSSTLVDRPVYNVFALPTESPNHGVRQLVTNPKSIVASPFGWHDDDGIAGADYTITRGNNVWAQEDRDGINSTVGFSPDGTSALNFNFPLDINQPPSSYQNVSITNLFYTNNMMHDIWYHHGFDERSGNFQANNYGNLGLADDYVIADAQDGGGQNNATFGTPPDGQRPNMTMFLWTPTELPNDPLSINNGSVVGSYDATEAAFGSPITTTPITANLILANDFTPDNNDACEALTNSAQINGNIAVIRRGICQFGFKALAAQNAGAIAVIIVNNDPDGTFVMSPGSVGDRVTIPSIMVSQANGEAIISALLNFETLNATLVNNGPFFIDGDFDNGIIAHEYGHGISTRLNSGPSNVNCLFNAEQMGEGWSDWFGLMVTMKATDTASDARGIGTFAISESTTGVGIRPRQYSPDFSINEFTYGDTNNPELSEPHGIGFVWATILWDLTWAYIDKYGFDSDLYNGNGGNNKIMKLVIDGLKLQPCGPGFVDGRDALLAADMATTGGIDQCIIWEVFANRGLGVNASQGSSTLRSDQVEDFSLPLGNNPSLANCSSLSVNDFTLDEVLQIYPNPTQSILTIRTSKRFDMVNIALIDINGRIVLEEKRELLDIISIPTDQLEAGLYILNIKGNNINYNKKIIKI